MIQIFNNKIRSAIHIDENSNSVQFSPKDYQDKPHIEIELKGFNFFNHAKDCKDCNSFFKSFGTESLDWYISYNGKISRLDMSRLTDKEHGESSITNGISPYFSGTKIILKFHELQSASALQEKLEMVVEEENYEYACILRDFINENN